MTTKFYSHFSINRMYPKPSNHLFNYMQENNESLRRFILRFIDVAQEIHELNHDLTLGVIKLNLGEIQGLFGRLPIKVSWETAWSC